jgi:5-methylthioadenosine/S-adenosylhomocysteine deaminase
MYNHPLIITNITVVTPTREGAVAVLRDAFVSVMDGKITYVGQSLKEAERSLCQVNDPGPQREFTLQEETLAPQVKYDVYSGVDRLLLPTFANGHSHIPMSILKNTADDMNLEDWLFNVILPRESKLLPSDIYYASLLGIAEMINGGTGAAADMYDMSEQTAQAALESGFRLNMGHFGKKEEKGVWQADLSGLTAYRKEFHQAGNGLLRVSLLVHSIYLYPDYLYPQLAAEAKEADVSIQVHVSETKTEVNNCLSQYGVSPVEALANFGIFDRPCIAAHAVHLSDGDRDILSKHNVTVAHNPSSNLKLASGVCDVRALRQKGVNVCIGTDGSASNNNLDMFIEMRLASLIGKERFNDPENMKAMDTLFMATRAGYNGMGFTECGMIEAGMNADFQVVRCDNPSIWPIGDPVSALVYGTPSSAVESVMIAGCFVKYRGELTTIDFEKVKSETLSSSKRILS